MDLKNYFNITIKNNNIILTPYEGYETVFIFMHGLGGSAEDFLSIFSNENPPIPKRIKVILLNSPKAKVTIYKGKIMNSWYDLFDKEKTDKSHSSEDVVKSSIIIEKVIHSVAEEKEISGDYSKIFLGGFSQGCAMALNVGLQLKENLGGVIGFSGALFSSVKLEEEKKKLPILLCHGKLDNFVHYEYAMKTYTRLKDFNVKYHFSNSDHEIEETGLKEMNKFFTKTLPRF